MKIALCTKQRNGVIKLPYGWITVRCYPNTSKVITVNLVLDELAPSIFMYINTSCLTIVDFATDYCGIGTCFYFKTSNPIVVYVIGLEITLNETGKLRTDLHYK